MLLLLFMQFDSLLNALLDRDKPATDFVYANLDNIYAPHVDTIS